MPGVVVGTEVWQVGQTDGRQGTYGINTPWHVVMRSEERREPGVASGSLEKVGSYL